MPPPAMLAHTGTCTPLTVGTQAVPTVPTGTSHRTGCSNAKLSKVTTRGTTANAAARGPETPTEEQRPLSPPLHPASRSAPRSPRALQLLYVPRQTFRDGKKSCPQKSDAQFIKQTTAVGLFLKYFPVALFPVYLN